VGKEKEFQLPADLTSLSEADLAQLEAEANAEFDAAYDAGDLARVTTMADHIEAIHSAQATQSAAKAEHDLEMQRQRERVRPPEVETPAPEVTPAAPLPASTQPAPAPAVAVTQVTSPALPTQAPSAGAVETLIAGGPMRQAPRKLNPTLADMRQAAPATAPPRRREAVLVASADIPGIPHQSTLADMDALTAAMIARARTLSVTRLGDDAPYYPVATMPLTHRYTLDLDATPEQVNEVLTAALDVDALVAAGGWCSPSEISYDFFNIVCEDGLLDLPSVGINRGGMRWPTSASFADVIGGANNFWSWNETQDVAALTGTGQSGTKVCARVPCPAFNEERLHCDGLCLTVGNLMEDAYPELISNHTRLLFAGHAHRLNQLRINDILGKSTAITGYGSAGSGLVAPVLGSIEISAIDYREKFAMCEDAVLEVVLPRWLRGAMRSDLRKRAGDLRYLEDITDARLMNMFDMLNIRVQWVTDWQVRSSGLPGFASGFLTNWPTSVQFLMWAAGTFVWGRGLQLNLGVVRDSVLNATNDHTGEWLEECWLISKVGHESRLGTIAICADGTTGAADLTACAA